MRLRWSIDPSTVRAEEEIKEIIKGRLGFIEFHLTVVLDRPSVLTPPSYNGQRMTSGGASAKWNIYCWADGQEQKGNVPEGGILTLGDHDVSAALAVDNVRRNCRETTTDEAR